MLWRRCRGKKGDHASTRKNRGHKQPSHISRSLPPQSAHQTTTTYLSASTETVPACGAVPSPGRPPPRRPHVSSPTTGHSLHHAFPQPVVSCAPKKRGTGVNGLISASRGVQQDTETSEVGLGRRVGLVGGRKRSWQAVSLSKAVFAQEPSPPRRVGSSQKHSPLVQYAGVAAGQEARRRRGRRGSSETWGVVCVWLCGFGK